MRAEDTTQTRISTEYCVMTANGRHLAYSVKSSAREAQEAIDFDGHPGLSIAQRQRTVTTTPWSPLDRSPVKPPVEAGRLLTIETRAAADISFGPDYAIASDTVTLIYPSAELLGWADDYGSVSHPDHDLDPNVKTAAERLVDAARDLLALIPRHVPHA